MGWVAQLSGLAKRRDDGERCFILRVPELELEAGARLALIGRNGSGKSTFLNLLALALKPDPGSHFFYRSPQGSDCIFDAAAAWRRNNNAALSRARREHVSLLPQSLGLMDFLTVEENLKVAAQLSGADAKKDVKAVIDALELSNLRKTRPLALSGGQRQRVAAGCALVRRPTLLLADEPTAALDAVHGRDLLERLSVSARAAGAALVIATHDRQLLDGLDFDFLEARSQSDGANTMRTTFEPVS